MENYVIKNTSLEHGKEIIKYFKSIGVNTGDYAGNIYNDDAWVYYGLINGCFSNYSIGGVLRTKTKIVTLEELINKNNMKKQVIRIEGLESKKKESNDIEFTHYLGDGGCDDTSESPSYFEKVVYIGRCCVDGDMFAAYDKDSAISIYKGHLNDGTY